MSAPAPRVIDMHAHTLCPDVEGLIAGRHDPMTENPYRAFMSPESRETDAGNRAVYGPKLKDPAVRLAAMDGMGVDMQVVAPAPAQQHYWAEEALAVALSRAQNDHVAAHVAAAPDRLAGIGTLPMGHPEAAVAEMTRGVEELGLRGFQIDARVERRELSDPALHPVWEAAGRLRAPVVVHPLGFTDAARLSPFFMVNSVGQPLEETLAVAHLISGGVLDRFPETDFVIAHGGGYFPFYVGRMDHAWKVRPEVRRLTAQRPSDYLPRLWFDTCVFRADHLAQLAGVAGAGRIMLGSDYPFDMGDEDPAAVVRDCPGLSEAERAAMLGGTAAALFRL